MTQQLYFEDVEEGMSLPAMERTPTTQQLVMYAGASGDFHPIHYDQEYARASGLPNVIVHGALKSAFLGQLLTDWIGEQGTLRKIGVQYRGMDEVGRPLHCKGVAKRTYVEDGQPLVECEVWIENADGVKTTPGSAVVALPRRAE